MSGRDEVPEAAELIARHDAARLALRRVILRDDVVLLPPGPANDLMEADQVLEHCRDLLADVESAVDTARQRGRAEGRRDGLAQMLELELTNLAKRREALDYAQDDIIAVAAELTRRVVGRALQDDPALLADMAAQCTNAITHRFSLRLQVHPNEIDAVRERLAELPLGQDPRLVVESTPTLSPGAARLDTERGALELSVDAQLEALLAALQPGAQS